MAIAARLQYTEDQVQSLARELVDQLAASGSQADAAAILVQVRHSVGAVLCYSCIAVFWGLNGQVLAFVHSSHSIHACMHRWGSPRFTDCTAVQGEMCLSAVARNADLVLCAVQSTVPW